MKQGRLKTVFAFLLTYKHVPFIYYGDEIGITHDFNLNKDGGYIRTGARTPMQWTNGKNRGFSTTDGELYLPVNDQKSQSVEEQLNNENSLLNTVKQLAKLRNENPALNADAELEIIAVENEHRRQKGFRYRHKPKRKISGNRFIRQNCFIQQL